MEPVIDHIQITVRDFPVAVAFYDRLMPLLGFNPEKRKSATISTHDFQVVEYSHPRLAFAITSPRQGFKNDNVHRRRPGSLHHLAFRAKSREEVDELHREVKAIGAAIVSPPREYPEYTPAGYYALFFKDLEGIKYEIVVAQVSAQFKNAALGSYGSAIANHLRATRAVGEVDSIQPTPLAPRHPLQNRGWTNGKTTRHRTRRLVSTHGLHHHLAPLLDSPFLDMINTRTKLGSLTKCSPFAETRAFTNC